MSDTQNRVLKDWLLRRGYLHEGRLGRGSTATVEKIRDVHGAKVFAAKVVLPGQKNSEARAMMLYDEYRLLNRLNDATFPRVETYIAEGPALVFEALEGQSLRHTLRHSSRFKNGASFADVLLMLRTLSPAIQNMHRARVIHADLTSSNVFLENSGAYRLLDLGRALWAQRESVLSRQPYRQELYNAPRNRGEVGPTFACDIYQLGVLGFEAFMGAQAFDRRFDLRAAQSWLLGRSALANFLVDMLDPRPENRPTAETLFRRLQHF